MGVPMKYTRSEVFNELASDEVPQDRPINRARTHATSVILSTSEGDHFNGIAIKNGMTDSTQPKQIQNDKQEHCFSQSTHKSDRTNTSQLDLNSEINEIVLPPSQPIISKQYSLAADIALGWQPRMNTQIGPTNIPLCFEDEVLDDMIRALQKIRSLQSLESQHRGSNDSSASSRVSRLFPRLIYLGVRPLNSFSLHAAYSNENPSNSEFSYSFNSKGKSGISMKQDQTNDLRNRESGTSRYPCSIGDSTNNLGIPSNTTITRQPFVGMNPLITIENLNNREENIESNNEDNTGEITLEEKRKCNAAILLPQVTFDSNFESGNLDCVVQVGPCEYDLFMRVDSNSAGHLHWFYFKAKTPILQTRIKFNICNFRKKKSLYARGMKPYVLSSLAEENSWKQQGENVSYTMKALRSELFQNREDKTSQKKSYYCLSFEYVFRGGIEEEVSFAYCPPYTYSTLNRFMGSLQAKQNQSNLKFFKQEKLCLSMSGLEIPLLTISDLSNIQNGIEELEMMKQRQLVIVQARIHPGESNSSYVMHGFLEFICSDNPIAVDLRKRCVFKVLPMVNPDGVVAGNYRTCFAGRDLNRMFKNDDKVLFPSVVALKELVRDLKLQQTQPNQRVFASSGAGMMFFDLHGHSVRKNVFTYGPDFPIFDARYFTSRLFCKVLEKHSRVFRYFSCMFRVSQEKETTARGVLFRDLGVPNCFTLEASNGSYYLGDSNTQEFRISDWVEMGVQMASALKEYIGVMSEFENSRKIKDIQMNEITQSKKQSSYSVKQSSGSISAFPTTDGIDSGGGEDDDVDSMIPMSLHLERKEKPLKKKIPMKSKTIVNNSKSNVKPASKKIMNNQMIESQMKQPQLPSIFRLEDSPLADYFSSKKKEEKIINNSSYQEKKSGLSKLQLDRVESDGFSSQGMDSDSDNDDLPTAYLQKLDNSIKIQSQIPKQQQQAATAIKEISQKNFPISQSKNISFDEPSLGRIRILSQARPATGSTKGSGTKTSHESSLENSDVMIDKRIKTSVADYEQKNIISFTQSINPPDEFQPSRNHPRRQVFQRKSPHHGSMLQLPQQQSSSQSLLTSQEDLMCKQSETTIECVTTLSTERGIPSLTDIPSRKYAAVTTLTIDPKQIQQSSLNVSAHEIYKNSPSNQFKPHRRIIEIKNKPIPGSILTSLLSPRSPIQLPFNSNYHNTQDSSKTDHRPVNSQISFEIMSASSNATPSSLSYNRQDQRQLFLQQQQQQQQQPVSIMSDSKTTKQYGTLEDSMYSPPIAQGSERVGGGSHHFYQSYASKNSTLSAKEGLFSTKLLKQPNQNSTALSFEIKHFTENSNPNKRRSQSSKSSITAPILVTSTAASSAAAAPTISAITSENNVQQSRTASNKTTRIFQSNNQGIFEQHPFHNKQQKQEQPFKKINSTNKFHPLIASVQSLQNNESKIPQQGLNRGLIMKNIPIRTLKNYHS